MKRLPLVILVFAVVAAVVAGCNHSARYDARLTSADSLMWDTPDSALAVLTAIDSLSSEANQAYRDLLVTQARYKCYLEITASDDSAISRAITHYRHHRGEREKLTRAYLYKGAIMEELGHIDSAMYYYKTAEVSAEEKDYTNLGQINTRIANLYRLHHGDMHACYEKSKIALRYYRLTGNKQLQLSSMIMIANSNGVIQKENSEQLLKEASLLATELNDSSSYYICQELLCRQLLHVSKSYIKAKRVALDCLKSYEGFIDQDLILDLADIYARTGMLDSAKYYINELKHKAHFKIKSHAKARLFFILSRISLLENDSVQSAIFDKKGHEVSDSILNNKLKYRIHQVESSFNLVRSKQNQSKLNHLRWMIIALIIAAVVVILSIIYISLRKWHQTRAIIRNLKNTQIHDHAELLNQLDAKSDVIGRLIRNLVSLLKCCSGDEAHGSTVEISKQIKETIVEVANEDFWRELRTFLDKNYNGIISTFANHPRITSKDLNFIELSCCGFSYIEMAIVLDYSPRYVINKRKIIAQKLGLDIPLQDYLEQLMNA